MGGRTEMVRPQCHGRLHRVLRALRRCVLAMLALALPTATLPADAADADDRLLLEVELQPPSPYVHARMVYQVRVLARVPLRQATLSDPQAADASVRRLGEDRHWQESRAGVRYSVLERRWAVVAQRVGPLAIAGAQLYAAVPKTDASADGSELIERLETLTRDAGRHALIVRPPPPTAEVPWLAAEAVSISEDWAPAANEAHVGVPLTRTLHLTASGASAAQLPTLALGDASGFKVYPERPQLTEEVSGNDLLATLTLRASYVPVGPGSGQIPALRLPWWNLGLDAPAQVQLAGRTLPIHGAAPATAPVSADADPAAPALAGPGAADAPVADTDLDLWQGPWLTVILALAWLATLLHCRRTQRAPAPPAPEPEADGLAQTRRRFERACRDGDAAGARTALLAWGRARWPASPPRGIEMLLRQLAADDTLFALGRGLDAHLYAPSAGDWQPAALLRACQPLLREPGPDARDAGAALPPLYPAGG